jgi:hypothetical protein
MPIAGAELSCRSMIGAHITHLLIMCITVVGTAIREGNGTPDPICVDSRCDKTMRTQSATLVKVNGAIHRTSMHQS